MRRLALVLVLLAGCSPPDDPATHTSDLPGGKLEAAAMAAGLVPDPNASIIGAWARDTDRVCVIPASGGGQRIGALVDYGDGQGCAASGTVRRSGGSLDIRFGGCRMTATFDGGRIVFPAQVPGECDRLCVGRASLAALAVDRQSESVSEAATLRTPGGRSLCAG